MNGCTIKAIPAAGSERRYFILGKEGCERSVVATYGPNPKENRAFIYLSKLFTDNGINVPKVLSHSDDYLFYTQQYIGTKSIFDALADARRSGIYNEKHIALLQASMELIASIHNLDSGLIDQSMLFTKPRWDLRIIRFDLNYFKYCFLKPSGLLFDEERLQDEFDRLEGILYPADDVWSGFMYRDFQSRNVMLAEDSSAVYGIDFQGGRIGPNAYDLASFLWQAKAAYPQWLKDELLKHYLKFRAVGEATNSGLPKFNYFVLFRVLQTLGAYGFRGWIERRPHFLSSINAGIRNLKEITAVDEISASLPYLAEIAQRLFDKYEKE